MNSLIIAATEQTPEVRFDAGASSLSLAGESYPDDTAAFFLPLLRWMECFLARGDAPVTLDLRITYFNSSSSKALLDILDMLDQAGRTGRRITINWFYHAGNDMALEYGQEYSEDLPNVTFNLIRVAN